MPATQSPDRQSTATRDIRATVERRIIPVPFEPLNSAHLDDESGIVWVRDIDDLAGSWLRESSAMARYRRGPIQNVSSLMVYAYSELKPKRGGQYALRRIWYRTSRDLVYAPWDHPFEAVDPASIRPRRRSLRWLGPRCASTDGSQWHQHTGDPGR